VLTSFVVATLAIGVYAQRAAGALLVDAERIGERTRRVLDALPVTIIAAVVALTALTAGGEVELDARAPGLAAAAIAAWRGAPMIVIVGVAALVTAVVRGAGWG